MALVTSLLSNIMCVLELLNLNPGFLCLEGVVRALAETKLKIPVTHFVWYAQHKNGKGVIFLGGTPARWGARPKN